METENQLVETWIFKYFSGELSEEEAARLWQWVEADEANRNYFAEKADWWATVHVPYFRLRMKTNFQKHFGNMQTQTETAERPTLWKGSWWVKAVAFVMVVISAGLFGYDAGKRERVRIDFACFETSVPLGSQSKVVLPDRSVVWVNAGSSLKYRENFNEQVREVDLSGEAYFEVAADSLKPFVVKSGKLDIRVTGTQFNVKAYKNEETIDVALVSGKVKVHLNGRKAEEGEVALAPDRMLSYNKETNCVQVTKINGRDVSAWTNGQLRFEQASFPQIAKSLERKFDVKIVIQSESLKKDVFSGSFSSGYSLDRILHEIDVDKKYAWTRKGNELSIQDRQ